MDGKIKTELEGEHSEEVKSETLANDNSQNFSGKGVNNFSNYQNMQNSENSENSQNMNMNNQINLNNNNNNAFIPQNFNRNFNVPQQGGNNNQGMGNYYFNNNMKNNYQQNNQWQGKFNNNQNTNFYNNNNQQFPYQKYNNKNTPYNNYQQNNFQNNFQNNYQNNFYNKQKDPQEEFNIVQSLKYVTDNYPHLIAINNESIGMLDKIKAQTAPRFYVIKSFTEEDIHKSIKYKVWSSTKEGNKKLNIAYDEAKKTNSDIFLYFSMNGSGRFVGIARMTGRVDEKAIFEYWAMDEVWKGLMEVEWLFIKDIPNKYLKDVKLSNNAYKPVTNSRDTQEIPRPEGEQMTKIFEEFVYQTNILQHFQYYDERQDLFEKARQTNNQNLNEKNQY